MGIALGYGLDDRGSRFRFPEDLGIFFFITASRTALGPTQPPVPWVPGSLSLGVNRPGREADHSPPSSAEVKKCVDLYRHSPNTPSWRGAHLKNHRDNFTCRKRHTNSADVYVTTVHVFSKMFERKSHSCTHQCRLLM
jgi:hypothetical protein